MKRTLRIDATFTLDGEKEPELIIMQRFEWPVDETIEQVAEREIKAICHQLHAPKPAWKLA